MYFHREILLGQLSAYIKNIKGDFSTHYTGSPAHKSNHALNTDGAPPTGKNLPEVVNNIVWARQLEAKVRGIHCNNMYMYSYSCELNIPYTVKVEIFKW